MLRLFKTMLRLGNGKLRYPGALLTLRRRPKPRKPALPTRDINPTFKTQRKNIP